MISENYCLDFSVHFMPGTTLYKRLERESRLIYEKWWLDEHYKYGKALFYPAGMTLEELERGCMSSRKQFNSYRNIFKRMLNPANLRNPFLFLAGNLISKVEINRKQGQYLAGVECKNEINTNKT